MSAPAIHPLRRATDDDDPPPRMRWPSSAEIETAGLCPCMVAKPTREPLFEESEIEEALAEVGP